MKTATPKNPHGKPQRSALRHSSRLESNRTFQSIVVRFLIAGFLLWAVLPSAHALSVGDNVSATENLKVRSSATVYANNHLYTASSGSTGRIISGPIINDGYIWWKIDWDRYSTNGWSVANYLRESAAPPDLIPRSFSISPSSGNPGQRVSVNFSIKNQGGSRSDGFTTRIRLSSSRSAPRSSDPLLDQFSTSGISAGSTVSKSRSVTIPSGTSAGTKYLWVIVDADSTAGQTNADEANDREYRSFSVTAVTNPPDLVPQSFSINPTSGAAGKNVSVSVSIKNQGGSTSNSFNTRIRLSSSSSAPTSSDPLLDQFSSSGISAGSTVNKSRSVTIPAGTSAGTKYLWIIVDADSTAGQTNADEANDREYRSFSVTAVTNPPDLVPQSFSINPTSGSAGKNVSVSVSIRNQGGSPSNGFNTRIRLSSSSSAPSSSDPLLDQFSSSGIPAGSSINKNRSVTIPAGTPAGTKYLWVIVDADSTAGQTPAGEANDRGYRTFSVSEAATPPDLLPKNFSISPASGNPGKVVSVALDIKNQGGSPSNGFNTRIRLSSSNSQPSVSDPVLAEFTSSGIPAGGSVNKSRSVTIPAGTGTGTKYLWVIVDTGSQAGQTSAGEANDRAYRAFNVTAPAEPSPPDLAPEALTINPASGGPGSSVSVNFRINNHGESASGNFVTRIRFSSSRKAPNSSDPVLAEFSTAGISPNSGVNVNRPVVIPGDAGSGTGYIWVIVDADNTAGQPAQSRSNDRDYRSFTIQRNTSKDFLEFPLEGLIPYTAKITAVLDHALTVPFVSRGIVRAYTGEAGTVQASNAEEPTASIGGVDRYSYKKPDGSEFLAIINYVGGDYRDPRILSYEGHTGYDFPYPNSQWVVAAAPGTVHMDGGDYNVVRIDHNEYFPGYQTYYLHMNKADTDNLATGDLVSRGQRIGKVGSYGTGGNHLHFTVKFHGQLVDPYGFTGNRADAISPDSIHKLWVASGGIPDARIGTNASNQIGNGTYNETGSRQTASVTVRKRRVGNAYFTVENDSSLPDNFNVRGTPGNRKLKLRYYRISGGNVTAPVTRGGLALDTMPGGSEARFKARIRGTRASRGKNLRRTMTIVSTSQKDGEIDVVRAKINKTP